MSQQTRQTKFAFGGLDLVPEGVTREDVVFRKTLEATKVLCPYCLYYGTLWDFQTLLKEKKGAPIISQVRCRCPDCYQGYMKKTLLRISEMTMEEYANWFWGSTFSKDKDGTQDKKWGIHDKVSWDKLKARLKAHFSYKDSQIFWKIYWEYKDAGSRSQAREDEEAFEDYKKTWEERKQ